MSLSQLAPLADVAGVRFVNLQHGPQAAELLAPPRGLQIEGMIDDSSSIADAAALITSLDLIISVDTMIAHLSGALGRPTWTLLRYATNWRWQQEGERTFWYPTMRLFRQSRAGEWDAVVERVRAELVALVASTSAREYRRYGYREGGG
jgi:ADP-heptose:LPS heptosyltransferase